VFRLSLTTKVKSNYARELGCLMSPPQIETGDRDPRLVPSAGEAQDISDQ
jgi:hypothetical protein